MYCKIKLTIACTLFVLSTNAQKVELVTSTSDVKWELSNKLKLKNISDEKGYDIIISGEKAQKIEGFGGCFNELGWDALMELSDVDRTKIIHDLFSPQEANFCYNRIPMGASDFAMNFYSFNDVADDFDMVNFSIDRDRHILLRYIKSAMRENPKMQFFASPWSPPAWMKTNNHYALTASTKGFNGLPIERSNTKNATTFRMLNGYLKAYALYFSKFIKAYDNEGVKVGSVYVQNEPFSNQVYASCKWRPEDLAFFIGEFLGPQFEADSIDTKIYFGTANTSIADNVRVALNDEKASKYIKGVGFQWSGKKALPIIRKEYPNLDYVQTESECGNGNNTWEQAEYTWSLINHYLTNGVSAYTYWNMILDHTGVSPWGWRQNALISINKDTKEVKYNPEYYIMKHVSSYVLPGANRLVTNGGEDHLAFINPNGEVVIVLVNKELVDENVSIRYKNKMISLKVKAKSFNTLKFIDKNSID